jgi:hypothetical protein
LPNGRAAARTDEAMFCSVLGAAAASAKPPLYRYVLSICGSAKISSQEPQTFGQLQ